VIVEAGGRDVGVSEPLLDLGDVGLVVEGIRGGRRAQRMGADLEAEIGRVAGGEKRASLARLVLFLLTGGRRFS
jgi:hypothetical protein